MKPLKRKKPTHSVGFSYNGAQTRNRTTDTRIFNPLLYRLSYLGKSFLSPYAGKQPKVLYQLEWCRLPESNWRPTDYKSVALPTELSRRLF